MGQVPAVTSVSDGLRRAWMASTVLTMFWASRAEAASIILPSSWAAPWPWAAASSTAVRMRRARSASPVVGGNSPLGGAICVGVNGPLALDAEGGAATTGGAVALGILEVTKRAIDGPEAVGAAGDDHPRD